MATMDMDITDFHIFEENVACIRALPGNNCCVDCCAPDPSWGSLGFGTIVCLDCAGMLICFHASTLDHCMLMLIQSKQTRH
jgi:hypothetical protein